MRIFCVSAIITYLSVSLNCMAAVVQYFPLMVDTFHSQTHTHSHTTYVPRTNKSMYENRTPCSWVGSNKKVPPFICLPTNSSSLLGNIRHCQVYVAHTIKIRER